MWKLRSKGVIPLIFLSENVAATSERGERDPSKKNVRKFGSYGPKGEPLETILKVLIITISFTRYNMKYVSFNKKFRRCGVMKSSLFQYELLAKYEGKYQQQRKVLRRYKQQITTNYVLIFNTM